MKFPLFHCLNNAIPLSEKEESRLFEQVLKGICFDDGDDDEDDDIGSDEDESVDDDVSSDEDDADSADSGTGSADQDVAEDADPGFADEFNLADFGFDKPDSVDDINAADSGIDSFGFDFGIGPGIGANPGAPEDINETENEISDLLDQGIGVGAGANPGAPEDLVDVPELDFIESFLDIFGLTTLDIPDLIEDAVVGVVSLFGGPIAGVISRGAISLGRGKSLAESLTAAAVTSFGPLAELANKTEVGKDFTAGLTSTLDKAFSDLGINSAFDTVTQSFSSPDTASTVDGFDSFTDDQDGNIDTPDEFILNALDKTLGNRLRSLSPEELARQKRDNFASTASDILDTSKLFQPTLDDDIINGILDREQNDASQLIANQSARGNLNAFGGRTANQELDRQREAGQTRLESIGGGLLTNNRLGLNSIRNEAVGAAQSFKLGDPDFDLNPFKTRFDDFNTSKTNSLESDFNELVGNEKFFNANKATLAAGSRQGLVSGGDNNALLSSLASKVGNNVSARRGLNSRNSGRF